MIFTILKKEIELSKKDFIIFFVLINSLSFLFMSQVEFALIIFIRTGYTVDNSVWLSILGGALVGFVISLFFSDKIKDSFTFLKRVIFFSLIIFIIEYPLLILNLILPLNVLYFINSVLYVQGFMVFFKLFLRKTSIIERGRILSMLLLGIFVTNNLAFLSIYNNLIFLFPVFFIAFSLVFLEKKGKNFATPLKNIARSSFLKDINPDSVIFAFFILIFGFTAGYALSLLMIREMLLEDLFRNILLIMLMLTILESVVCLFVGVIFDSIGRYAILSVLVVSVALSTYLSVLQLKIEWIPLIVAIVAYITVILAIPLLIGDTSKKESFGRDLTTYFLVLIVGIAVGIISREITHFTIGNIATEVLIVSNTSLICCVFSVLIITFMQHGKESYSFKERQWKDFLIHMYIIHSNGLLIYEKDFIGQDEKIDPLFISGGLVGLLEILKVYFHSMTTLRIIDHGDRKIMFKFNSYGKAIVVLVVKEDLFILRKKLNDLIELFDAKLDKEKLEYLVKMGSLYQSSPEFESMINIHFASKVKFKE